MINFIQLSCVHEGLLQEGGYTILAFSKEYSNLCGIYLNICLYLLYNCSELIIFRGRGRIFIRLQRFDFLSHQNWIF